MLVFRRKLFLNDNRVSVELRYMQWAKDIDGQIATFRDENANIGTCGIQQYLVQRDWCEEVVDK